MRPDRALVLAGARPEGDPVATYAGVSHKALVELGGRPLLERVMSALADAGFAWITVVSSNAEVAGLAASLEASVMPAEAGPSLSALKGVEALGTPVLVTTSDHALLEAAWVERFLDDAPPMADVCVLLARRDVVEAAAAGSKRTYLKFADGEWSGCNLFLLRNDRALGAIRLWRTIEADRKRPWRIIRRLGPWALVRYLTGRMTLTEALERLGRLCGASVAAVDSPYGLAAVDVDKPADLDFVRGILGKNPSPRAVGRGEGNSPP